MSFAWLTPGNGGSGSNDAKGPATAEWFRQHGDDPEAIDKRFGSRAQAACEVGADDFLREIAAHDFAWDHDAEGFWGDKFDKYGVKSVGNGLITLNSDRAKLSNGFGAYTHIKFYCLYDAKTDKVVRYSQENPIIDAVASKSDDANIASPAMRAEGQSAKTDLRTDPQPLKAIRTEYDVGDLQLDFPADRQERRPLPNGTDFFNVSGTITNVGQKRRAVPTLRIVLRDRYNGIVYSLDTAPAREALAPGESETVNQAIIDAPKSTKSVEIKWKPDQL